MTKIQKSKQKMHTQGSLEHWILEFGIWDLFVIWCLKFGILK